jgi:hypothetical protein
MAIHNLHDKYIQKIYHLVFFLLDAKLNGNHISLQDSPVHHSVQNHWFKKQKLPLKHLEKE